MGTLISVVEAVAIAVAVHEARQEGALRRVPKPLELPGLTYFSVHDIWLYQARADNITCDLCRRHQEHGEYHGNHLRSIFPYLEIMDDSTIVARVHPNCRCYLVRLLVEV